MPNIAAIIVIYNPNINDLYSLINNIQSGFTSIYIMNNSTWPLIESIKNTQIVNFNKNIGIAKAQSLGMKKALDDGAEFIVQLDQDSKFTSSHLHLLLSDYKVLTDNNYKVGLISGTPISPRENDSYKAKIFKGKSLFNGKIQQVSHTISSTSLISRKAILDTGFMDDDLFIDLVDFEYCWRLIDNNWEVFRSNECTFEHSLGEGPQTAFYGLLRVQTASPIRNYYQFRNLLVLLRRDYVPISWKVSQTIKTIIKFVLFKIIYNDFNKRLPFIKKGILDGFKLKLGAYTDNHDNTPEK